MRKIILIILISFFVFGCRTKKVIKEDFKEVIKEQTISKAETVEKEDTKTSTSEKNTQVETVDKKEDKSDIQIVGKVDKENPMTYYNIVNGDTIDLFKISGNADFIFKTSSNSLKLNVNTNTTNNTTNESRGEKSISNAVENVKVAVKEVQKKSVDIVKKDLTFGTYLIFFLWGLAIIAVLVLILWLRKANFFSNIINKFK